MVFRYFSLLIFFVPYFCLGLPEELQVLYERRTSLLIEEYAPLFPNISEWTTTFSEENGTWSDVDYATGCDGRRANWPAQQHFVRIVTMSSLYYTDKNNITLLPMISKAMDYWFNHDYEPDACLDLGGVEGGPCPCGTSGFWNTNWFGQMILLPRYISATCLLLKPNLTDPQLTSCNRTLQRVLNRIDTSIEGIGPMTGANMLDASSSLLNLGLLLSNLTLTADALAHFYSHTLITPGQTDGIKPDGAYLQHNSLLYNGNYGKEFIKSVSTLYLITSGTSFEPSQASQQAFLTLLEGSEWMMFKLNDTLWWQHSVIGRMVSFAVVDRQASAGVSLNWTRIELGTAHWTSRPSRRALSGTRSFYSSDYLVHRSDRYVISWKAFSRRTTNAECNNGQNPSGYHLSDGSILSYLEGDEYKDVFAAWDWNLIPGTTVQYGATRFECDQTQVYGNTTFVGSVVSDGGMAVMDYLDPITGRLSWQKTFYFFPGFYAVQIGPIVSTGPVVTTLDQSNLKGQVYLKGQVLDQASYEGRGVIDLWHNRVLYTVLTGNSTFKVDLHRHEVNDWSRIGISQGRADQEIFTATLEHTENLTYLAQLDTDRKVQVEGLVEFGSQEGEDGRVRAAYYKARRIVALAFWTAGSYSSPWGLSVMSDQAILTYFTPVENEGYRLSVSDPTQSLTHVTLTVTFGSSKSTTHRIELPQNPYAGKTVSINI